MYSQGFGEQVFRDPGNPQRRRITREQLLMAKQLSVIRYFRIHNGVLYNETEMGVLQPLKDMIDEYASCLSILCYHDHVQEMLQIADCTHTASSGGKNNTFIRIG